MSVNKNLVFLKCFGCSKTINIDDLIELTTNSLVIGAQTIEFPELILDVCLYRINPEIDTHICYECKDLLVQFHIFKSNVKKSNNFHQNIKKSEIFLQLETLLDRTEATDSFEIVQYKGKEILIAEKSQQEKYKLFQENLETPPSIAESTREVSAELPTPTIKPKRQTNQITASSLAKKIRSESRSIESEIDLDEACVEIVHELEEDFDTIAVEVPASTSTLAKVLANQNAKWNTNTSLTEQQKTWIWEEARKGETKKNEKIAWKCTICSSKMSSSWVLRKHLRDVHILNPSKHIREKGRGKAFMDEVRSCKTTMVLEDGQRQVCWKCKRCENILKSESGCIKHLMYTHINGGTVDPSFIAKCKIQLEYENGQPGEIGWACPECKRFYRTTAGIKNHLKKDHRDIDFGGEKYQKKMKEASARSMLLKETEKHSEILLETENGRRKIWQCSRCEEPRYFKSETGFKAHVRNAHIQRVKVDDNKVDACRVALDEAHPKQKIFKCSQCACTMRTRDGFISHVTQDHPKEFAGENSQEIEPFNAAPTSVDIKGEVLEKLLEQIDNDRGGPLRTAGYKFSCPSCGLYFSKHYSTHLEVHRTFGELAKTYELPKCEQCQMIFCNDEALLKHLEWHVEDSDILVALPSRGLSFYGGKEYQTPIGTATDGMDEDLWKCGHCFAVFWLHEECVHHIMILHTDPLVCPVDNLAFTGNRGLTLFCSHMKNKHSQMFSNLVYPCTYCNVRFESIYEKLKHMKTCFEKRYECDGCGRKFFTKIKLSHHLRIEKGLLRYECSVCFRRCTNSMDLKLHVINSHTNSRLYACTYQGCEKSFKTSAARSSHLETHSNVTLKCPSCEAVFKKRSVLARHVKTMHDKVYREECYNEFHCNLCNKSFLRRISFKNHLKIIHNIIEEEVEA